MQVVLNTINGFKENYNKYGVRAEHKAFNEMLEAKTSKVQQQSKSTKQEESQDDDHD